MEDNRTAHHDRCVFCGGFRLLFFSLAGTGPVRKVYVPDPARIAISLFIFMLMHNLDIPSTNGRFRQNGR